MEKENN